MKPTLPIVCPHCKNDDEGMIDAVRPDLFYCLVCGKAFEVKK